MKIFCALQSFCIPFYYLCQRKQKESLMISKTFNRYIWLLNTLLQYQRLTFEQISDLWSRSAFNDGEPLPIRTFHMHRNAVEELFQINIECDSSDGYKYYISTPEVLRKDRTRQWLINSFSLSNMIDAGHNMKDRILFEDIPGGTEYLQTVIEAMQFNKELQIKYRPFSGDGISFRIQPYAMKVYNQRWYIVGYIKEQKGIRNIALDRTLEMEVGEETFTFPNDFDPEKYFSNSVGIYVNENLKPQKVILRVFGIHVEYMRSLPLHFSQREINAKHGEYSDFQYKLSLTPELTTKILSMGEKVEVMEPKELRDEIKNKLLATISQYK